VCWKPGSLTGADAVGEIIASKDLNNLYRTSCFFRDMERYRAFCAQYAIMRLVDDRVDGFLAESDGADWGVARERTVLKAWDGVVQDCLTGGEADPADIADLGCADAVSLLASFARAVRRFPVPAETWTDFFHAMNRDLDGGRFATYGEFLAYTQGATVAPTTIYLYLVVSTPSGDGQVYRPSADFRLLECGRALGRFAYLGHILRDLAEDLGVGKRGVLYLAADDMAAHGVSESLLFADHVAGHTSQPVRALVGTLIDRARTECARGQAYLEPIYGRLAFDQRLVLGLIISTYQAVLDKIVCCDHEVMGDHHHLTETEKLDIVQEVFCRVSGTNLS
jgi:phytoene synthase